MAAIKFSHFWVVIALALFLFFSLTYIELPGLQYDEVNFINAAMGNQNAPFVAYSVKLFGKKLPLMIMNYIGAVKPALYAPIFKIFGTSAVTARLPVVGIGLITLLISYALFRRMFDRTIAVAALLLFATDPTFIFSNKLDWGPVSLMLVLETFSLYCMWRWMKEGNRYFLGLAGFLFGLGLYNKIIFAWFITAFFIALLLFFRENFVQLLKRRHLVCFLPAFLLGCLPLIAFNIAIPMETFRDQKDLTSLDAGVLISRYNLFRWTLDGAAIYYLVNQEQLEDLTGILKNEVTGKMDLAIKNLAGFHWVGRSPLPLVLVFSLVLILVLLWRKQLRWKKEILFLGTIAVLMAVFICLTASATGPHHVIAIYPFVFIIVAFAIVELGGWLGKSRVAAGIVMAICSLPLVFAQLVIDARYLKSFQGKGGAGSWSDAIYELAAFARENPDKKFYFMEWGFSNQLVLLTNGHIQYEEFICDQKNLDTCMDSALVQMNSYLVFHIPPFDNPPVTDAYRQALARHHLQSRIVKTFYQRDGRPVYLLYETTKPYLEAHVSAEQFFYAREAEDFDATLGGSLDNKAGASNRKALGNFWGHRQEDYALYKFNLPRSVSDARLYLRYAFEDPNPHQYYLFLDGNFFNVITLPSTHGYGYRADQWKTFDITLGDLSGGMHELKIRPAAKDQVVNLDYWYLREGSDQIAR